MFGVRLSASTWATLTLAFLAVAVGGEFGAFGNGTHGWWTMAAGKCAASSSMVSCAWATTRDAASARRMPAHALPPHRYTFAVLAGLVLSACGDVALLWRSEAAFLVGLAAFLLAHCCYALAFAVLPLAWRRGVAPAAAAALAAAYAVLGVWLAQRVPTRLLWPVRAYVAVISVMCALGAGACAAAAERLSDYDRSARRSRVALLVVAPVLFYISDLSVATDRFVQPHHFGNRATGLTVYFVAQLLFARSIEGW